MKKHNILFQLVIAACAGMLFHGCQKEEPYGLLTLKAVVSDDYGHPAGSKTHIIDKCVYWDNGDFVNINGTRFDLSVATNESVTTATIDSVPVNANGYVAVYPAGFVTTPGSVAPNSESVGITIPRILYMKPGHTQNTQGLMVATMAYGGTSLSFHNAGSVLALDVTNGFTNDAELKLYRIVVKSSTSGLSGAGTLTIDGSAPSYSITGSDSLTLDMEDDTILHNATKTYYIPIPPQEQDGGTQFTIIIYATNDDNHYKFTRNSQSGLTVQRNKQVPVSVELSAANVDYTINTINGGSGLMGSGTESDPYVIATLTDLKYFRTQVNGGNTYSSKYIRQTADIDASANNWTPIGTSTNKFSGIYDGGGHTVTIAMNPTDNNGYGYFDDLNGSTIKNLTLNGTCATNSYNSIGAFCGTIGGGTCTFENCTNNIPIEGLNKIGGFIGLGDASTKVTMINCINNAQIKGTGKASSTGVGGLIGSISKTIEINKCKNNGAIKSTDSDSRIYVGGLVGFSGGGGTIFNSTNAGELSGTTIFAIGGIVGNVSGSLVIANCYNKGIMKGKCSWGGGIIGIFRNGQYSDPYIENSFNIGSRDNLNCSNYRSIADLYEYSSRMKAYNYYYLDALGAAFYARSGGSPTTKRYSSFQSNGKLDSKTNVAGYHNGVDGSGQYEKLKDVLNAWVNLDAISVNPHGFSNWVDKNSDGIPELDWE